MYLYEADLIVVKATYDLSHDLWQSEIASDFKIVKTFRVARLNALAKKILSLSPEQQQVICSAYIDRSARDEFQRVGLKVNSDFAAIIRAFETDLQDWTVPIDLDPEFTMSTDKLVRMVNSRLSDSLRMKPTELNGRGCTYTQDIDNWRLITNVSSRKMIEPHVLISNTLRHEYTRPGDPYQGNFSYTTLLGLGQDIWTISTKDALDEMLNTISTLTPLLCEHAMNICKDLDVIQEL